MLLSELFEHLVSGELAQLSMGDIDDLTIGPKDFPRVIPTVNLALTELYKRFPIRIEEVIVRQRDHMDTYVLHDSHSTFQYSKTVATMPHLEDLPAEIYIHDSKYEPFINNVLRIEQVYNELGVELPLNEEIDYDEIDLYQDTNYQVNLSAPRDFGFQSVKTPTSNSIQILPRPHVENNLLVKFRAAPEKIILSPKLIPGEVEIDLPLAMLEPMLLYVGGRVYANMRGEKADSGAGFYAKFEASCRKIEELNLFNKGNVINTKLDRAGWV